MTDLKSDRYTGSKLVGNGLTLTFVLISLLFFLWGFSRSILDVLNRHFQDSLSISVARSTLIQGSTYLAYAVTAIPAGILISRAGYRRGIVAGLSLFALGAFCFIPGAAFSSFAIFLIALFVIGAGLAILETAANPYVTELGPQKTAPARLNLSQAFNGFGSILGPVIVGSFLFSVPDAGVDIPYLILGIIVAILAILFTRINLPEISPLKPSGVNLKFSARASSLLKNKGFVRGFIALFCYEIAEIGVNSLFINYALSQQWLDKMQAAAALSFGALLLFMIARLLGSALMTCIKPESLLKICATMAALAAIVVVIDLGAASHCALFALYAFEAIMFPTIFALTIARTPSQVKTASSFLMMSPLGGAAGTILMGLLASYTSFSLAFLIPATSFLVILLLYRKNG